MTVPFKSHRARVGALDTYYEVRGSGSPLIMLHGAILVDLGPSVDHLARGRQVITPHLQGRGHTSDIDRPFSYEAMADDVAGLMQHAGIRKADILGQSMGAGVALRLALRHPESVGRLVLISTAMKSDGWQPKVLEELVEMETKADALAADVVKSDLSHSYPEVDWATLFRKTGAFQQRPYDLTEQVRTLAAQSLLVFADEDAVRPDHVIRFWEALGGGRGEAGLNGPQRTQSQLAVLPNSNHSTVASHPLLAETVANFLQRAD
jgi:pimeloyl-ACP methyl ester carboxylesterase